MITLQIDPKDLSNVRIVEKNLKLRPTSNPSQPSGKTHQKKTTTKPRSNSNPYHKKISNLNKKMIEKRNKQKQIEVFSSDESQDSSEEEEEQILITK